MKDMAQRLLTVLVCPACRKKISPGEPRFQCANCRKNYSIERGIVCFTDQLHEMTNAGHHDSLTLRVKKALKKSPVLFRAIHAWIAGPSLGLTAKTFARRLGKDRVILDLGSGPSDVGPNVINLDYFAFANVDIAADIHALPFPDGSVDAVISQSVLEHLENPERAVAEMVRVLKPGGLAYVQTPFLHAYHSSPRDFRRWTDEGLENLFAGFSKVEAGVIYGPTSAFVHIASEWLGMCLSFGSRRLQQMLTMGFQILFGPFRLLDLVVARHPSSAGSAHILFFVGKKN